MIKFIVLDTKAKTRDELLKNISDFAKTKKITTSSEKLMDAFIKRENEGTTGFEYGIAIPHARIKDIKENVVIIARNKYNLDWNSMDGKSTKTVISILVSEADASNVHMEILSKISQNLLDAKGRETYISGSLKQIELISKEKEEVVSTVKKSKINIVGVTACATGVVHTYMAQKALVEAGNKLKYNVRIETQGQKGQEFKLTDEEIKKADVVIIAADINVDLDRFDGKKVFMARTGDAVKDPRKLIKAAIGNATVHKTSGGGILGGQLQQKKGVMTHILSGVSRMIPFIVFSGIVWAILNALTQAGIESPELNLAINGASVGFTFFIAMMGGFIGESVGGRAAFAPAAIATFVASNAAFFWNWAGVIPEVLPRDANFNVIAGAEAISTGWTIVGAIAFGFLAGHLVIQMNKIKLSRAAAPLLPILIIPVVATSLLVFPTIFIFGAPVDWVLSSLGMLIGVGGQITGVNFLIGFILGAMIGFDMGGPVNKIAGATSTALIQIDPRLLGAVEAAIPIAPLGVGLATLISKKVFDDAEKGLGIAALGLGFFGISEGAIPFAAKRPKSTIITNVFASAIAGGLSFMFFVGGHVGMWGGPIVAFVLGIYADSGTLGYSIPNIFGGSIPYISILWFFVAIIAGTVIHSFTYLYLIRRTENGKGVFTKKPLKLKDSFMKMKKPFISVKKLVIKR